MAGHTRRFNPSHQWIHKRVAGRRTQDPADGRADLFLPAHQHQRARQAAQLDRSSAVAPRLPHRRFVRLSDRRERIASLCPARAEASGVGDRHGHEHRTERPRSGAICTLSLSFNNDGPLGTFFRYICDNGTYIARYDELLDGKNNPIDVSKVDVSMNGIELQDREFFAAIRGRARAERQPRAMPAGDADSGPPRAAAKRRRRIARVPPNVTGLSILEYPRPDSLFCHMAPRPWRPHSFRRTPWNWLSSPSASELSFCSPRI